MIDPPEEGTDMKIATTIALQYTVLAILLGATPTAYPQGKSAEEIGTECTRISKQGNIFTDELGNVGDGSMSVQACVNHFLYKLSEKTASTCLEEGRRTGSLPRSHLAEYERVIREVRENAEAEQTRATSISSYANCQRMLEGEGDRKLVQRIQNFLTSQLVSGASAAELPVAAQAMVLEQKIIRALEAGDDLKAKNLFTERDQLQIKMPPELMIKRARFHYRLGDHLAAHQNLTAYLATADPASPLYESAVTMLSTLEEERPDVAQQPEAEREATAEAKVVAQLTPKCKTPTTEGDAECWLKVANQENCYRWNPYPKSNESVSWSGQCKAGKPDGNGEEVWQYDGGRSTGIGSYRNGKEQGQWELRYGDMVETGPYVNGKRHGQWEIRFPDGNGFYTNYVNDKVQDVYD